VHIHAVPPQDLHVELVWDKAWGDADLHLTQAGVDPASAWFLVEPDCFFGNKVGNWPPNGPSADASLDIDDTDGFGPENINVDRPGPGVYRVGVHGYSGRAGKLTVRIYCGGSRLEPRATLGPIALSEEQVWKAADVVITDDGRCQVKSLARPDGSPELVLRVEAEKAR